ncbi:Maf family nucleotide pyrophosphatase [Flavobacterium agricola]|uniref:dTTP/UTP pyrophosphatase n=1 Tax=Flavobacterium agricola TaxID=2870839 RepID=A0ABY6M1R8_9FLAO|nr:Maf family nucleotide pyrophosphatase [Flavobacterium agricola]UYW02192.1 Maf family nucleotide pyrophosphatase [Flavobacterium agricola]
MPNKNFILASGSPRRQQFFKDFGIPFTICVKEVNEVYPPHLQAHEITTYLAELKASVFTDLNENDVVITSDTLVWHQNKALGKPKDTTEAFAMLQALANNTHQVITSVCFKTLAKTETIYEVTEVTFGALTPEMINYYIKNYNPLDKAGAYGIQEWIGEVGIVKINGSYTNVVGLPVSRVYQFIHENYL